jgi:hypothetical protein
MNKTQQVPMFATTPSAPVMAAMAVATAVSRLLLAIREINVEPLVVQQDTVVEPGIPAESIAAVRAGVVYV